MNQEGQSRLRMQSRTDALEAGVEKIRYADDPVPVMPNLVSVDLSTH